MLVESANPSFSDNQWIYLDPFQIERRRIDRGLSLKDLTGNMIISMNTLKQIYEGRGTRAGTADRLAKQLKCAVTDLLSPRDARYIAPAVDRGSMSGASEWDMDGYLSSGRVASNGLYYIVCRMKHRYTTSKTGRGKFYHLSLMNPQMRKAIQNKLTRHAEISARVGLHANVSQNLTSTPAVGDAGWWVIDDWVGESTLGATSFQVSRPTTAASVVLMDCLESFSRANPKPFPTASHFQRTLPTATAPTANSAASSTAPAATASAGFRLTKRPSHSASQKNPETRLRRPQSDA